MATRDLINTNWSHGGGNTGLAPARLMFTLGTNTARTRAQLRTRWRPPEEERRTSGCIQVPTPAGGRDRARPLEPRGAETEFVFQLTAVRALRVAHAAVAGQPARV